MWLPWLALLGTSYAGSCIMQDILYTFFGTSKTYACLVGLDVYHFAGHNLDFLDTWFFMLDVFVALLHLHFYYALTNCLLEC